MANIYYIILAFFKFCTDKLRQYRIHLFNARRHYQLKLKKNKAVVVRTLFPRSLIEIVVGIFNGSIRSGIESELVC